MMKNEPVRRLLVPRGDDALRRNNLDAIRLAMALVVLWSHCFAIWRGSEDSEPVSRLMAGTYNSGNLGVLAFFAISGFLITLSWTRAPSWRAYLKRRIARIHPGYLAAITLCSLVIVPAFSTRAFGHISPDEAAGLISNLLLRNYILSSDAFGGTAINGSLWSIPYEFWCYLGVLALGVSGLIRWRTIYPLAALAVMGVRIWLDLTGRRPGGGWIQAIIGFPYFWFNVLPPFLLGGAIFLFRERLPRSRALLMILTVATIASAHLPLADPLRTAVTRLFLPPTLTYAIFYVAFSPRLRAYDAARFGDFSYGIYLYAFPIQQMLAELLRGRVSFPLYVVSCAGSSIAAGVASWYLVERWFLPRVRVHGDRKPGRPLDEEASIVAP